MDHTSVNHHIYLHCESHIYCHCEMKAFVQLKTPCRHALRHKRSCLVFSFLKISCSEVWLWGWRHADSNMEIDMNKTIRQTRAHKSLLMSITVLFFWSLSVYILANWHQKCAEWVIFSPCLHTTVTGLVINMEEKLKLTPSQARSEVLFLSDFQVNSGIFISDEQQR